MLPPAAPSAAQPSAEAPRAPEQSAPEPDLGSDNAPLPADLPAPENNGPRPYLGISVLYTVSMRDGQQVSGLEVMDVDADSPASRAGLKARTPMTTIGASGATAGELLGPLDAALRPLLAKSGQLGEDGDLIVAIDDHRVTSDSDLPDHLAPAPSRRHHLSDRAAPAARRNVQGGQTAGDAGLSKKRRTRPGKRATQTACATGAAAFAIIDWIITFNLIFNLGSNSGDSSREPSRTDRSGRRSIWNGV